MRRVTEDEGALDPLVLERVRAAALTVLPEGLRASAALQVSTGMWLGRHIRLIVEPVGRVYRGEERELLEESVGNILRWLMFHAVCAVAFRLPEPIRLGFISLMAKVAPPPRRERLHVTIFVTCPHIGLNVDPAVHYAWLRDPDIPSEAQ